MLCGTYGMSKKYHPKYYRKRNIRVKLIFFSSGVRTFFMMRNHITVELGLLYIFVQNGKIVLVCWTDSSTQTLNGIYSGVRQAEDIHLWCTLKFKSEHPDHRSMVDLLYLWSRQTEVFSRTPRASSVWKI